MVEKMKKIAVKVGVGEAFLEEAPKKLICSDKKCHIHGNLKTRGRIFEGRVIRKSQKRITIEFERMIYIKKYERYTKTRTKIHARIPDCLSEKVKIGDLIRIQECRPLSKIIHFTFIEKLNESSNKK